MPNFLRLFFPNAPPAPSAGKVPAHTGTATGGGLARLLGRSVVVHQPQPLAPQVARLAFVIDATMSRYDAWKEATQIQCRMVDQASQFGRIEIRLIHFGDGADGRPPVVAAFPSKGWSADPRSVTQYMRTIRCAAGETQLARAMQRAIEIDPPPSVVVVIGDAFEEGSGALGGLIKELVRRKLKVFSFFEGDDLEGQVAYKALAVETGGAFACFGARLDLSSLMMAAASYAAGGDQALLALAYRGGGAQQQAALAIAEQLQLPPPSR